MSDRYKISPEAIRSSSTSYCATSTKDSSSSTIRTNSPRYLETSAPEGICTLVERRLASLTDRAIDVVTAAAVTGRTITADLVGSVCRLSATEVFDAVEEALAARLLVEDNRHVDRYHFPHALIRNAVLTTIEPERVRDLHRLVGESLELEHATVGHSHTALAYHFVEAAPLDPKLARKAVTYAQLAGDDAMTRFAWDEAARWYEAAARFETEMEAAGAGLGRLNLALGRAYAADKQHDRARAAFLAAADYAWRSDEPDLLADVALAADGPWSTGSEFQSIACALLEEALAAVDPTDMQRRIRILNGIATDLYYVDPEREGLVAREALELAGNRDEPEALALAQLALHRWYTHQPEARVQRLAITRGAFELTAPCGPPELQLHVHRELLADLLENGHIAEFDSSLNDYETNAAAFGSPRDIYWAMALRATQATLHGDLVAAEQLARGAELRGHELEQLSSGARSPATVPRAIPAGPPRRGVARLGQGP